MYGLLIWTLTVMELTTNARYDNLGYRALVVLMPF